jgi:hypothetical protein
LGNPRGFPGFPSYFTISLFDLLGVAIDAPQCSVGINLTILFFTWMRIPLNNYLLTISIEKLGIKKKNVEANEDATTIFPMTPIVRKFFLVMLNLPSKIGSLPEMTALVISFMTHRSSDVHVGRPCWWRLHLTTCCSDGFFWVRSIAPWPP